MKKIAANLENNLSEQLKLYNYLDRITDDKKVLIIKGDAESLAVLDRQIETVTCELLELEKKRLNLLKGLISKESKLSDFINLLDPEFAKPLSELRERLTDVMARIQHKNKANIFLIENSIKWVQHSIKTIVNVISPESAAYNFKGRVQTKSIYEMDSSGIIEHQV